MKSRKFQVCDLVTQITVLAQIMRRPKNVPVVLVVDASTSMDKRREAVVEAVGRVKQTFANMDDDRQYFVCIIEFADEGRLSMPFTHAATMPETYEYNPGGNTKLYSTVYEALAMLMAALDETKSVTADQQITLAVFSDGDDNLSPPSDLVALQDLARRAKQSEVNVQLQTYGIGISAHRLASFMGFNLTEATTVEATAHGVQEAMDTMTTATTMPPGYACSPNTMAPNQVSNPPAPPVDQADMTMLPFMFDEQLNGGPIRSPLDHTLGSQFFPPADDADGTNDPFNTLI